MYELFGIIGGFLGVMLFIPQIIKTIKTKSVKDLSIYTWVLIFINVLFWMFYGVFKNDLIIMIPNMIAVFLTSIIFWCFKKYV